MHLHSSLNDYSLFNFTLKWTFTSIINLHFFAPSIIPLTLFRQFSRQPMLHYLLLLNFPEVKCSSQTSQRREFGINNAVTTKETCCLISVRFSELLPIALLQMWNKALLVLRDSITHACKKWISATGIYGENRIISVNMHMLLTPFWPMHRRTYLLFRYYFLDCTAKRTINTVSFWQF